MNDQANHLLRLLNDIERAVVFLSAQPAVREVGSQARNPNRPGSREPISLDLIDVCAEVPAMLTSWVRLVWEERDAEATDDAGLDVGPDGVAITQLCRWLRQRVTWIARRPWVDELGTELGGLRHRLQRAPGSPLLRDTTSRVVCPKCGETVIVRAQDRGTYVEWVARCTGCHQSLTEAAVDDARLQSMRRLNWRTAAEIVDALGSEGFAVTATQIRKWGDRGHIANDPDHDPRRVGDKPRRFLPEQVRERVRPAQRHAQVRAHVEAARDTA